MSVLSLQLLSCSYLRIQSATFMFGQKLIAPSLQTRGLSDVHQKWIGGEEGGTKVEEAELDKGNEGLQLQALMRAAWVGES